MRVVDVTQCYGDAFGGIRTYLHAKAAFAAAADRPHAIVVPGPADTSDERVHGSMLARVRGRSPARRWGYRMVVRPGPLLRAIERHRPDVVVLHDCVAFPRAIAAWARRNDVRLVMVCHSDLRLSSRGLPPGLRGPATVALGLIQRRGFGAPATVLLPSDETGRRVGHLIGCRTVRIPLGVDITTFAGARPDPELRSRLAPDGAPLLLYAGRLSSEKGVDLLAKMLVRIPDARLAIAGAGASEAAVMRSARRLEVAGRLRFLGFIDDRDELARHMATADCFVHPNHHEAFGLTPIEALAAGCRVVAPDSAGCRENLTGRGAVLVRPDDAGALADGVRRALGRPRPRPDLGDLGWERTFTREWEVYESLCTDGR